MTTPRQGMLKLFATAGAFTLFYSPLAAFEFTFDWGPLELCTSGTPNVVPSPAFHLKDVPQGTGFIRFRLTDLDVPDYPHGGGLVAWDGQAEIAAGAFSYKSPCPPDGAHEYQWRATALQTRQGTELGRAVSSRTYP